MATIHQQKLARSSSINPGVTTQFRWAPGNWSTTLQFWVEPVPPAASGEHGSAMGRVQVTKMETTHLKDNDSGDQKYVDLWVKNTGTGPTQFDVYMSWIT